MSNAAGLLLVCALLSICVVLTWRIIVKLLLVVFLTITIFGAISIATSFDRPHAGVLLGVSTLERSNV